MFLASLLSAPAPTPPYPVPCPSFVCLSAFSPYPSCSLPPPPLLAAQLPLFHLFCPFPFFCLLQLFYCLHLLCLHLLFLALPSFCSNYFFAYVYSSFCPKSPVLCPLSPCSSSLSPTSLVLSPRPDCTNSFSPSPHATSPPSVYSSSFCSNLSCSSPYFCQLRLLFLLFSCFLSPFFLILLPLYYSSSLPSLFCLSSLSPNSYIPSSPFFCFSCFFRCIFCS